MKQSDKPTILVPYSGPAERSDTQDVFVFMRPDTNGTLGEGAIMQIIRQCPEYGTKDISLVYLANVPSHTLISNHIYEQYHALKIHFAARGGVLFTPHMRRMFCAYFGVPFESARVIGAFKALQELSMSPEELFLLRVGQRDLCMLNGQSIKRYRDYFIVNYDVPALVHRYSLQYDIAIMCFRMTCSYNYFVSLTKLIREKLIEAHVIAASALVGSGFHHSHGPFGQLRDGAAFLLDENETHIPLEQLSFGRYLRKEGVDMGEVHHLLINPIVLIDDKWGERQEVSLMDYTYGKSYRDSYLALTRVAAYSTIDPLI